MNFGVKFCGGCNSNYDRIKAFKQLEKCLDITILPAQNDVDYDVIYVICGCSKRCPNLFNLRARRYIIIDEQLHDNLHDIEKYK